ncbi:MAG: DNA polymerase III subunit beta [Acidimicrobiales bacterium]
MKFRCERDVLVDALVTTGRAAGSGTGVAPALSGAHLLLAGDTLRLTATDRDLTIQVRAQVAGQEDGACVVPARLTGDIVRSLEPGAVVVEATGDEARISSGRSQFGVRTYPEEEFPRVTLPLPPAVTVRASELSEAMRQVVRAASADDTRPTLTGVLLAAEGDGLRLVATDSYRLAQRDLAGTDILAEDQQVLVPARALAELQRLLAASGGPAAVVPGGEAAPEPARSEAGARSASERRLLFRLGDLDATFEVGAVTLTTRLIKAEFPNTRNLFPASYPNRLVVGKEALLDAVRRVKLLVRDANSPVRMALGPDGIQLTASDQERGHASEDVDAKYEGAELTIAFNPTYLIDGVEAVVGDEVLLEIVDGSRPATVRANDADPYRYLLMPVRVS